MAFLKKTDIEQWDPTPHEMAKMRGDLNRAGLLKSVEEIPAGTREREPSMAAQLFAGGGFGCIHIPPDTFGEDELAFAAAIYRSIQRMEPAYTPLHKAVYRTMSALADAKVKCDMPTFVIGLLLAAAKIHDVPISTNVGDIAKECHIRKQTLYRVRKAAIQELSKV